MAEQMHRCFDAAALLPDARENAFQLAEQGYEERRYYTTGKWRLPTDERCKVDEEKK